MRKSGFLFRAKKGFTLVEVIAVLAIMAIATAIVLPNVRGLITQTEFRQYEGYCITANTYTTNYVNLLNLGETKIPYEERGEHKDYFIDSSSGLTGALNTYSLEDDFQYFVLSYNSSKTTDPSPDIKTLISAGTLAAKDVMIVNISVKTDSKTFEKTYTLVGFWYYKYTKGEIVCTYKHSGNQSGMGFYRLDKDVK